MTEPTLSREEEDTALAGEYVLGVHDPAERAAIERRLRADTAFAAKVQAWEHRLASMNDGFAEAPAPQLMPAIEARLFGKADAARVRSRRSGWFARFASGAVMASLLVALALTVLPPPIVDRPALQATLQADGQTLVFAARYDEAAQELIVSRTGGNAAEVGRVHELWLIAGNAAPVPLGLIEAAELRTALPALPEGAVLAVSLEPTGGSTTGAPTGPVLVTGVVTRL
jgi:anti-sigma-K factor RskA